MEQVVPVINTPEGACSCLDVHPKHDVVATAVGGTLRLFSLKEDEDKSPSRSTGTTDVTSPYSLSEMSSPACADKDNYVRWWKLGNSD